MDGKIFEKVALVNKEIKAIDKGEVNQAQGFKFRSIGQVMDMMHGLLAKHGIVVAPQVKDIRLEFRQNQSVDRYGNNKVTNWTHAFLTMAYRYTCEDGSYLETINVGEGLDNADKAVNKAMTAALKYSISQLFTIPFEDMPDADSETPDSSYMVQDALAQAIGESFNITSRADFETWWNKHTTNGSTLRENKSFMDRAAELGKQFPKSK